MNLDQITYGDRSLLHMERYVDEGAKTYSAFSNRSGMGIEFRPSNLRPSFKVFTVCVPKDQVCVFEANPSPSIRDKYVRSEDVLFAVHPHTWSSSGIEHLSELRSFPQGKPIPAAPTASSRTVLTTEEEYESHFLKLHCPVLISRFNRKLVRKDISNSVGASEDMEHVNCSRFAFLADSLGLTYGDNDESWGFIVRERVPRPFRKEGFLIPYFALYAGDLKHPEDPPLLVQLISRLGVDPESFAIEEIMIPVLECWCEVARRRGILLESHSQNILLEIDENFKPRRVVHRDFDVRVDFESRNKTGMGTQHLGSYIWQDTPYPIEQHYSLVYDHFIGNGVFNFILNVLKGFYRLPENRIIDRVKAAFHENFPDAMDYFPHDTTFYFSSEGSSIPGVHLKDTKQPPLWR